jgi:arginase
VTADLVVLGVPIDCVGIPDASDRPVGTELSPGALRAAGLLSATGAADAGDLPVRLVGRERDAGTGVLAWPSVREVTAAVRSRVTQLLREGKTPLVLGGCCTLLPGALAGARDAIGAIGLAYLDGHLDLYDGVTSPTGEPADMPIAVVTGHGPAAWVDAVGPGPLVAPDRVALLGPRDRDEAIGYGSVVPEQLGVPAEHTPARLRAAGLAITGAEVAERLGRYWVHLDVDVLDEQAFPATDYLMPGGLTLTEVGELLRPLVRATSCVGLSVGCYNPQRDPDGSCGRDLVSLLADALGPSA